MEVPTYPSHHIDLGEPMRLDLPGAPDWGPAYPPESYVPGQRPPGYVLRDYDPGSQKEDNYCFLCIYGQIEDSDIFSAINTTPEDEGDGEEEDVEMGEGDSEGDADWDWAEDREEVDSMLWDSQRSDGSADLMIEENPDLAKKIASKGRVIDAKGALTLRTLRRNIHNAIKRWEPERAAYHIHQLYEKIRSTIVWVAQDHTKKNLIIRKCPCWTIDMIKDHLRGHEREFVEFRQAEREEALSNLFRAFQDKSIDKETGMPNRDHVKPMIDLHRVLKEIESARTR